MAGSYQHELRRRTVDRMAQEGTDRLEVWQEVGRNGGVRMVGHMDTTMVMRSTSPFYQIRRGDFVPGVLDDGTEILIASWTLGPGDLEAVSAFRSLHPARKVRITAADLFPPPVRGRWPRDVLVPLREIPRRG